MRILVINRERSHASLVGSALKRLGHRAQLCGPDDALDQIAQAPPFDGVIAEAASATLELVSRLRAADVPVALAGDVDLAWAAENLTSVLPRVWTVVDLRRVVGDFTSEHRRLAQGSSPAVEFDVEDDRRSGGPEPRFDLPAVPPRSAPIGVTIGCHDWGDVLRLCTELEAGRTRATVRGQRELTRDQRVMVRLRLPDELVLTIPGFVAACQREVDGRYASAIELTGLAPARLRSLIPLG